MTMKNDEGREYYNETMPAAAVIERIAAAEHSDPASDDLTIPLAIECAEWQIKNRQLREALKPLAGVKLWSDDRPDCHNDFIRDSNLHLHFTVDQVKAARAACADEQGGDRGMTKQWLGYEEKDGADGQDASGDK